MLPIITVKVDRETWDRMDVTQRLDAEGAWGNAVAIARRIPLDQVGISWLIFERIVNMPQLNLEIKGLEDLQRAPYNRVADAFVELKRYLETTTDVPARTRVTVRIFRSGPEGDMYEEILTRQFAPV